MRIFVSAIVVGALGVLPVATWAAAGEYWEITTKMDMPGMPMAMPATTTKICIPKGEENDPRHASPGKECEMTDVKVVGNHTTWKVRCNQNGDILTGTGDITGNANGSSGTIRMAGSSGGHPVDMTQTYSSKRVGGACDAQAPAQVRAGNAPKAEGEYPPGAVLEGAKKLKGLFGF